MWRGLRTCRRMPSLRIEWPLHRYTQQRRRTLLPAVGEKEEGREGVTSFLLPMYTADNHIMTLYTHLVLKEPALSYDDYNEVAKRDSPKPGSLTQ